MLNLDDIQFTNFFKFIVCAFCVAFKKSLTTLRSQSHPPLTSRRFTVHSLHLDL